MRRSANRGLLLVAEVKLWWYAAALMPILGSGWLVLTGLVPAILAPVVLFAFIFWLSSFAMAVFARLRGPRPELRK